ncbi:serine/threonine protein kinase [Nocardiopsis algeriensis]|uniref:Protein kinase domain-containing protein n=1 Tax=Nocardiopsis algeriensis TaxID=1478215 RepID=A0A841IQK8_9ACTN|nr:serine/threonine-protein kinase [Nocardiopsis algeriensis]MBB6120402.1 hypothetical protein [Nocardiopsis algeriensis]
MAMSAGFPMGEELPERIGHYVIRRRIGQGGMGVVYQAEDPRTEQFVAVKVLKPEVAGDRIARARLAREVETMRRVQSPNVAEVIDANIDAELPWVVTEYIPGPTLDSTVTDHGPLRGRALTRFVTGLAQAIKDIHAVDVIHRDLKPGNVIISNGEPIVIDFGIAHAVDGAKLTQTGTFVGTPSYLSPEVIEGTALGPATDIHAWGGTVAFASTGRPPYGSGAFEVIFFRILNGEIDMEGMHEALRPLVTRAVARDMSRRPTAAEIVEEAGRLNLDLPWTEDPGLKLSGATGSHTVYHAPVTGHGDRPAEDSGGLGGAAAAGAAGAALGGAAGYLAGHTGQGWESPSGPQQPVESWSTPAEYAAQEKAESWSTPAEYAAQEKAESWSTPAEYAAQEEGIRDADTERVPPAGDDPQGTMMMDPVGDRDATGRVPAAGRDDPQGTMMMDPVGDPDATGRVPAAGRDDPQGTMMMDPVDDRRESRVYAEPDHDAAPQTQFFNTPLHKGDFSDILTPVEEGRSNQTQTFDEDDHEERGGWLSRFRRGRSDRLGDYFRGDGAESDEYDDYGDEYGDEYEDEAWRMHPLVLVPIMIALAGVGLWFPWIGIILGIVVIAGLSALDVVKAEHAKRLQTRGARSSDTMVVALSFPWAFGRTVLRTIGFGLIYLLAGILIGMIYASFRETAGDGANYTGGFAIFVTMLLSYIMPSGRGARHQAVWLVERVRFTNLYVYIGVVVAIVLFTMFILSVGLSSAPVWELGPLQGPSDWFSGSE